MCHVARDDEEQPTVYCANAEFMRAMPRHDDRKIYLRVLVCAETA